MDKVKIKEIMTALKKAGLDSDKWQAYTASQFDHDTVGVSIGGDVSLNWVKQDRTFEFRAGTKYGDEFEDIDSAVRELKKHVGKYMKESRNPLGSLIESSLGHQASALSEGEDDIVAESANQNPRHRFMMEGLVSPLGQLVTEAKGKG